MRRPTSAQRLEAEYVLEEMPLYLTDGEVWTILDAVADGEDPADALDEYRRWRTPHGRRAAADDAFESGRPLNERDR